MVLRGDLLALAAILFPAAIVVRLI